MIRLPILVALLIMVIWGATPVATRLVLVDFDPVSAALFRTSLGGIVALPIALALRVPLPRGARAWGLLTLGGFCGFVGFPLLYSFGQQMTSAMHGSLVMASLPVLTGFYAAILERRWPRRAWFLGCALALAGEAVLIGARAADAAPSSLLGDALVLAASLLVALGYVAGARLAQRGYPSLGTTLWGIALATVPMGLGAGVHAAVNGLPAAGGSALAALAFLAIVTSIVGYLGWYWALARGGIARIATIQFLQPLSGLLLAFLILGERATLELLGAAILILAGIIVVQRPRRLTIQ
ncbi:MAG: DMT family transporter [Alphaproteobacteria bacterium]|nr:DMT family transporter [Alphaproteobacteria bacterium]